MLESLSQAIGPFTETTCDLCGALKLTLTRGGRKLCFSCLSMDPKFHFWSRTFKLTLQQSFQQAQADHDRETAHPPLLPADLQWVENMMTEKGFV